jgi:hypothetical protein
LPKQVEFGELATKAHSSQSYTAAVGLLYPLQTPNGEVKTISFRRGKAKDMMAAQRIESNPARAEVVLMALLAQEKLTAEDLEELDLADLANVQKAFQGLFLAPTR